MKNKQTTRVVIRPGCTFSLGNLIAAVISWHVNQSIGWTILHGLFGWFYILYYLIFQW